MRTNDNKVCYGIKSTMFAIEQKAVETLLISDHLFRAKNVAVRKQYVQLAEDAEKKNGIKVIIFSSMTQAGSRLKDMTGIAGILFYALPEIEDIEEDSEHSSDEDKAAIEEFEEESKESSQNFEDEQLDLLMNEGMIGYEELDDLN